MDRKWSHRSTDPHEIVHEVVTLEVSLRKVFQVNLIMIVDEASVRKAYF